MQWTDIADWWGCHWRDVLDVIGVVGTVLAAVLAWRAIRQSGEQGVRATERLRQERRIDFELDLLKEMALEFEKGANVAFTGLIVTQALRMLPPEEFARTRAYYGMPTTKTAEAELAHLRREGHVTQSDLREAEIEPGRTYGAAIRTEHLDGISRRLDARHDGTPAD